MTKQQKLNSILHFKGAPVGAAAVSPESYSVIATAAILPPPPNFLCSETPTPGIQTVPIPKVHNL